MDNHKTDVSVEDCFQPLVRFVGGQRPKLAVFRLFSGGVPQWGAQWRDEALERAPEGTTKAGAGADGRWVTSITNLTCTGVRHSTHDAITTLSPFSFCSFPSVLLNQALDQSMAQGHYFNYCLHYMAATQELMKRRHKFHHQV